MNQESHKSERKYHINHIYRFYRKNQLISDIFLEKSCIKCDEKKIPRPFSKKSKLSMPLDR